MEWMFMPLKRYAEFSGRSRRMEYWMWVLFQVLLGCAFLIAIVSMAGSALLAGDANQALASGGSVIVLVLIWVLVSLAFFIPNLAVTVRRLHDTNRSGWWMMLYWGPYLLSIFTAPSFVTMGSNTDTMAALGGASLALSGIWFLGCLVLLVFMFLDGTPGPNAYGPDPKGRADAGSVFA
ncbi:MAG: DUF805 domain-containing protein [Sphingomonas sp.]